MINKIYYILSTLLIISIIISFSAFIDNRYAHADAINQNLKTITQSLEKINYRLDLRMLSEELYVLKDQKRELLIKYKNNPENNKIITQEITEINKEIDNIQRKLYQYKK